jgi:hypothetical protein
MTNFNKPAMGFVLIGALVLGGCSGGGTQYTSETNRNNTVATRPGETTTTQPGDQTANNNGATTNDQTANNNGATTNDQIANNDQNNANNNDNDAAKANGNLNLVSYDKTAKPGQEVTLTAKAEPGTKVKIEADGAGIDMGLGDQKANDQGQVTWKWKIDKGFKADKMPIIVTALYDDIEKKQVTEIKVDQPQDKVAKFQTNLTGLKTSVKPGEQVTIRVKTAPKADVKIEAQGIDGMGPGSKKANDQGIVEFSFKVDDDYKADKMPIIVTTDLDGKEKKMIEAIEVPKVAMKNDGKNL